MRFVTARGVEPSSYRTLKILGRCRGNLQVPEPDTGAGNDSFSSASAAHVRVVVHRCCPRPVSQPELGG